MIKHSKPPARQRYEAAHPTLTVWIPADVKTAIVLAAHAEGLSIGEWLQAQVAAHVTDVATAYQRGYTYVGQSMPVDCGHPEWPVGAGQCRQIRDSAIICL